jgi:MYXO-CTERM domain-containing protein
MKRILVVAALLSSFPALAHISLTDPPNRYASTGLDGKNKECPCGFNAAGAAAGNQLCSNGVTTDNNRSNIVTTYTAGQQVTVTIIETVGHSGRMRIAFDENGADLATFNQHILADVSDPTGSIGRICTIGATPTDANCTGSNDNTWAITVTLPNTPCTNCTLQVIQDMNGVTGTPVADPTGDATYFQCADLILTAQSAGEGEGEGAAGEGEGEGAAGEGEGEGAAGEGEGEGAAGEGEGAAGEGEGAAGEGEGEGEGAHAGEGEGEGSGATTAPGCNCGSGTASADVGAMLSVGLVGLAIVGRRRRR